MLGYRVPDPDEAMLISGGRVSENEPFKVVTGRGKFVMPGFRRASFLSLSLRESEISEECNTTQGIKLQVRGVIAFKVGNNPEAITNAGQRFLSDQSQMETLTGRIFAGHLRSIVGSMTVEDIIKERQKLAEQVVEGSREEMARLGLVVDALQIQSIDDGGVGYIEAIAAPHNAAIQRQAKIAEAEANQASAEAEQQSARKQAEFARETAVQKAEYKAQEDKATAEAAQAGPLAQAEAQKAVIAAQTTLAQQNASLREQELVAEKVKPAEAEGQEKEILAKAEAEATKVRAEAASSSDRISLDQMIIERLPDMIGEASKGLSRANINLLQGADGLGEVAAGLITQGMTIFKTARDQAKTNGEIPEQAEQRGDIH